MMEEKEYTNYWNQPTDFTDEEWDAVLKEFKYVCKMGEDYIHEVTVSKEQSPSIRFTATGCESFYIGKRAEDSASGTIDYCETNARTIDIYVWHMLTFCQMIKEDFTCSRDWWYWEKKSEKEKA
tara:strand:- start:780 stop:1151 length:372 start_codon:yes stop_codon:yes gene_type:complete